MAEKRKTESVTDSKASQLCKAYDDGMSEMASFRSVVRHVARYFRPDYGELETKEAEGSEVCQANTSAGILAQMQMGAGIYSNTLSMGKAVLEAANPIKRDMESVKRFYGHLAEKANDIVSTVLPEAYRKLVGDYGLTSAGVLYARFNEGTKEHELTDHNPLDCVWYEDANGRVNKLMRGYEYTADQAVERFGYDMVSDDIRKAYDDDSQCNKRFRFIHVQQPRKKRDKSRLDDLNMPFEDLHIEHAARKIVKEGGQLQFRYIVPVMFKRDNQRTGYSPAMFALPSMRTLVRGTDDYFNALEFKSNPTLFLNDRESVDNARNNLRPGNVVFAKLSEKPFLYGAQGDPQAVDEMNGTMKQEINKLHFLDLFNALEEFKQGQRTAYEVAQIIAEKIHLISPVIHPLKDSFFGPLFEIIAHDIVQYGLLDEPVPMEVEAGDAFTVRYTSRIDSRMGGIETENLMYAVQEMAQIESTTANAPNTSAFLNLFDILEDVSRKRSLNPKLTKSKLEYEEELERMNQQAAQVAAMQVDAQAASRRDVMKAPEPGSEADVVTRAKMQGRL